MTTSLLPSLSVVFGKADVGSEADADILNERLPVKWAVSCPLSRCHRHQSMGSILSSVDMA